MSTTVENNKLIAEFMGVSKSKIEANGKVLNFANSKYNTYHSDWNVLLEVVEKIESLGNYVGIFSANTCEIKFQCFPKIGEGAFIHSKESKIQSVYNAVVEFINFYNSAQKEN